MKRKGVFLVFVGIFFLMYASLPVASAIQHEITFHFDDGREAVSVRIWDGTVRDAMDKAFPQPNEIITQYKSDRDWDEPVAESQSVNLQRLYDVTVTDAGMTSFHQSTSQSVAEFLWDQGIDVSPEDKVNTALESPVQENLHIVIDRVNHTVAKEREELPFEVVRKNSQELLKGKEKVEQEGKAGYRLVEVTTVLQNGEVVETRRDVIEEVLPTDKVIVMGTKSPPKPKSPAHREVSSRGGNVARTSAVEEDGTIGGEEYEKKLQVVSTAYTHTGNRTSTGKVPGPGTVAVDPSVIPYGTKMYIPGYGVGVAQDKGGAIVGNRIDVFFETAREAYQWGRKNVTIYILK